MSPRDWRAVRVGFAVAMLISVGFIVYWLLRGDGGVALVSGFGLIVLVVLFVALRRNVAWPTVEPTCDVEGCGNPASWEGHIRNFHPGHEPSSEDLWLAQPQERDHEVRSLGVTPFTAPKVGDPIYFDPDDVIGWTEDHQRKVVRTKDGLVKFDLPFHRTEAETRRIVLSHIEAVRQLVEGDAVSKSYDEAYEYEEGVGPHAWCL